MRRLAAVVCAVLLAGCASDAAAGTGGGTGTGGAGSAPAGPMKRLAASLEPLHHGVLSFEIASYPGLSGDDGQVGYRLTGPFSDPGRGQRLPVLRLTVQPLGTGASQATIVSTGTRAWVVTGGTQRPLTAAQTAQLAAGVSPHGDLTGLGQLGVANWVRAPGTLVHTTLGGTGVDEVTAPVDPVAALNGLETLVAATGGSTGAPISWSSGAARALRGASRSADVLVAAGTADHLLRLFEVHLSFAAPATPSLRSALGPMAGLRLTLRVEVDSPG